MADSRTSCLLTTAVLICCCIRPSLQLEWQKALLVDNVGSALEPSNYLIHLNLDEGSTNYKGEVQIELKLKPEHIRTPIRYLVLHADSSVQIDDAKVIGKNDQNEIEVAKYLRDHQNHLISIVFAETVPDTQLSQSRLHFIIAKRHPASAASSQTLFWNQYTFKDEHYFYGLIDLTKPRAPRVMFPCFDVDHFRTTITLTLAYGSSEAGNLSEPQFPTGTELQSDGFRSSLPISLRSIAVVLGRFTKTSLDGVPGAVYTIPSERTDLSAARDTLKIMEKLSKKYNRLAASMPSKKLDIFVLPELECLCESLECALDSKNDLRIDGWGVVIGTRESVLISERSTDDSQRLKRLLNLSKAMAHQYLTACYGCTRADMNWHAEAAAAYLAVSIIRKAFPADLFAFYFHGELMANAMDYNLNHSLRLDSPIIGQCHSSAMTETRFYKALALWSELVRLAGLDVRTGQDLRILVIANQSGVLTAPIDQIIALINYFKRQHQYQLDSVRNMLNWRAGSPTYDIITLMPLVEQDKKRVIFSVEQAACTDEAPAARARVYQTSSSCGKRNLPTEDGDSDVFVHLTITFVNSSEPSRLRRTDSITCTGKQLRAGECVTEAAPDWFSFDAENHVFANGEENLYRYYRFAYTDSMVENLSKATSFMTKFDRMQLIEDLHALAKMRFEYLRQLDVFVAGGAIHRETEPEVQMAYLRVRVSLVENALFGAHSPQFTNADCVQRLRETMDRTLSSFKTQIVPSKKMNMMMFKGQIYEQLIDLRDELITKGLITAQKRISDLPLNYRKAFYKGLTLCTSARQIQRIENLLKKVSNLLDDDYDEKYRIASAVALVKTDNLEIRRKIRELIAEFSRVPRRHLNELIAAHDEQSYTPVCLE